MVGATLALHDSSPPYIPHSVGGGGVCQGSPAPPTENSRMQISTKFHNTPF